MGENAGVKMESDIVIVLADGSEVPFDRGLLTEGGGSASPVRTHEREEMAHDDAPPWRWPGL